VGATAHDGRVPRQSDPIDDRTPLNAARIDLAARVGWLLRTHRTVAGVSLREMSEALEERGLTISPATLSRVESEGHRSAVVIEGYTDVLGLPDGSLGATINGVCRGFPYAPPAVADHRPATLETFSRACDEVAVDRPTAGAWLTFASLHAKPAGFGLPLTVMEPLVQRLTDEVGRGVTASRLTRHEALGRLAESPYGPMTLAIIRETVEDVDNQTLYDLTSVLSDHPSPELTAWACRLLASPSLFHVRGASFALQGMLVHGGLSLASWQEVVPLIRVAQDTAHVHPDKLAAIGQVVTSLPPALRPALRSAGVRAPARASKQPWGRTRGNPYYLTATTIARAACRDLHQPDEPLLERLLFEACFEVRGVRMSVATWTLLTSPFASALARAILRHDPWPDEECRAAATRVASAINGTEPLPGVAALLEDDALFGAAATILGRSGGRLPDDALARGLAGDETMVRQTLYALGMAGDPRLTALVEEGAQPPAITRAARWWLTRGGRVLA